MERHLCKVCGKQFPSGRSLGGHMRSHLPPPPPTDHHRPPMTASKAGYRLRENPKKKRLFDLAGGSPSSPRAHRSSKEAGQLQEHNLCSQSDNDAETAMMPVWMRRSTTKCEYEVELEEGAISLMMLSRGVWFWSSPALESSDKHSVVLECKKMDGEEDAELASDGSEIEKERRESELSVLVNGYPWNSLHEIESEVSVDGSVNEDGDKFKKPKLCASDAGGYFEESDEELGKNNTPSSFLYELGKKIGVDGQFESTKVDTFDAKSERDDGPERSLYECSSCNKTFHSFQALGGHRANNKRMGGRCRPDFNASENRLEVNASLKKAASFDETMNPTVGNGTSYRSFIKIKSHECFICGKVFQSGQALGGHKRSHLLASSNDGICDADRHRASVNQQQSPEMPNLIDLNLPAPVDGNSSNASGNSVFKPWWAESNLKHEQLIGVISNC